MITRESIIKAIQQGLQKQSTVYAFWLEGADAKNTVDKYSDLDVWLDVKDGNEKKILKKLKEILGKLGQVDFDLEINHPHPKIRQEFFHLKGTSKFLIIDVCVQGHSRIFWYTKGYVDEKVKIIFDKTNVITYKKLNQAKFNRELKQRASELRKAFTFFQVWVEKEIERINFLEAVSYYNKFILEPLVEMFRIKYEPTKRGYYLKHIKNDLPVKIVSQLEDLYKIDSLSKIKKNIKKANKLFESIRF